MDSLTWLRYLDNGVNFGANLLTIVASTIVIVLYFINRNKINSVLNLFLNYSRQLTLSELKHKIERLNEFDADNSEHKKEVLNNFHDIQGQLNGNKTLKNELGEQLIKVNSFIDNPKKLTDARKRSLVSYEKR
jgi:hypothetical protein